MRGSSIGRHPALGILALAAFLAAVTAPPASAGGRWEWRGRAEVESYYDSNVFNLSSNGEDRVDDQDSEDKENGRIRDMESVDDVVFIPRLALGAKIKNSLGSFSVVPSAAYRFHVENDAKDYPQLGLLLRQTLPHHSAVQLEADWEVDAFKKNYLKDTTVTGEVVTDDQRIYERGKYDDLEFVLGYERRLWRRDHHDRTALWPSKLTGAIDASYSRRRFDDFSNRDLDIFGGRIRFTTAFDDWVDFDVGYRFKYYDARGRSEVVIIDESDVGIDLDGDGDALDDNVATVTDVDRTRYQHEVGLKLKAHVSKRVRLSVGYEYIFRDYQSDEPLDLSNNGREDDEHVVSGGLRWEFRKRWFAALEGEHSDRDPNKSAALVSDEDSGKTGWKAGLKLTRKF
jgi:hypothetical protein